MRVDLDSDQDSLGRVRPPRRGQARGRRPRVDMAVLGGFAAVVLAGCGGSGSDDVAGGTFSVRDSAGVRIIENSTPAWKQGKGWRLSQKPAAQIGVVEGDRRYVFSRITAGVLLPDGGFAVADGSATVRAYGNRGGFRWTSGRKGRGPGEFERISSIELYSGDSLLVFDGASPRFSVLTDQGRYVRSGKLPEPGALGHGASAALPLPDGSIMVVSGGSMALLTGRIAPGYAREADPAEHLAATGELLEAIGPFPGTEWYITKRTVGPAPFAHVTSYAVRDSALVVGTGEETSVGVYSSDGRLLESVRWRGGDLAATGSDVEAYRQAQLARARDAEQRRMTEARLAGMTMPKRIPAYSNVAIDGDRDLWVGGYQLPGGAGRSWSVFSPAGQLLGTVPFPARFRVLDIGSSSVLGVWTDGEDVEHVRVYAIEK